MIIKTKICAGGGRSLTRFPLPRFRMEECLKDGGKRLDLSRAMLAFTGDPSLFQVSDRDDERVLWAAHEREMVRVCGHQMILRLRGEGGEDAR